VLEGPDPGIRGRVPPFPPCLADAVWRTGADVPSGFLSLP
jgi:hypothetical protein